MITGHPGHKAGVSVVAEGGVVGAGGGEKDHESETQSCGGGGERKGVGVGRGRWWEKEGVWEKGIETRSHGGVGLRGWERKVEGDEGGVLGCEEREEG
jgi:hypothetical protein